MLDPIEAWYQKWYYHFLFQEPKSHCHLGFKLGSKLESKGTLVFMLPWPHEQLVETSWIPPCFLTWIV